MTFPRLEPTPSAPRFLSAADLHRTLSPARAVEALARGLAARTGEPVDPVGRTVLDVPNGKRGDSELLLMPSHGPEGAGAKVVTIVRSNPRRGLPTIQGLYVLFAPGTLTPELLIDGAGLTRLRTAAVSALATRHLARPDSHRLVVFGAGEQAAAHVEAMRAELPIEQVVVVGSSPDSPRARRLVAHLRETGVDARLGAPDAVAEADVVCTCTTSEVPVFQDGTLAAGAHVNAVGAYQTTMCELPATLLARAVLVVETEQAALAEAGDIVQAIAGGMLAPTGFAHELSRVIAGKLDPSTREQLTVFKSVGLSVEDLILARAVADELDGRARNGALA